MIGFRRPLRGFAIAALAVFCAAAVWTITAPNDPESEESESQSLTSGALATFREIPEDRSAAVCVLTPAGTRPVTGTLMFRPSGAAVEVTGTIEGLPPGRYQFQITEFGDPRGAAGGSLGDFFASPDAMGRVTQDGHDLDALMSFEVDASGSVTLKQVNPLMSYYGAETVIGRAFVLYSRAISRSDAEQVAFGVIGRANPDWEPSDGPSLTSHNDASKDSC